MLFICRSHLLYNTNLFHKKAGTGPRKPGTGSRDRQILTRAASADDVHRGQFRAI